MVKLSICNKIQECHDENNEQYDETGPELQKNAPGPGRAGIKTVEALAGGGMVKVVANGGQKIESIILEKEVVDPEDVEMLQDLVLAAVNDALKKSQEMVSAEMNKLTGGLNIPGL